MKDLLIVKAGTGVVSNLERTSLDYETIEHIGNDIARIENAGAGQLEGYGYSQAETSTILVSSGAITAGRALLGDRAIIDEFNGMGSHPNKPSLKARQMLSMLGNVALFHEWSETTGLHIAMDLLTHNDLSDEDQWRSLVEVIDLSMTNGLLVGFNEADARSSKELQDTITSNGREFQIFGDNDQLAARVGVEYHKYRQQKYANADLPVGARAIFLSDVNGVWESVDRGEDSRIPILHRDEIEGVISDSVSSEGISNGGMYSKLTAAKLLVDAGVEVSIGTGKGVNALMSLYEKEEGTGTHIVCK